MLLAKASLLGFPDKALNAQALQANNGEIQRAIDWLCAHALSGQTAAAPAAVPAAVVATPAAQATPVEVPAAVAAPEPVKGHESHAKKFMQRFFSAK